MNQSRSGVQIDESSNRKKSVCYKRTHNFGTLYNKIYEPRVLLILTTRDFVNCDEN